jgi:hypothetical protein
MRKTYEQKSREVLFYEIVWLEMEKFLWQSFWWMPRKLRFLIADKARKLAEETHEKIELSKTLP